MCLEIGSIKKAAGNRLFFPTSPINSTIKNHLTDKKSREKSLCNNVQTPLTDVNLYLNLVYLSVLNQC